MKKNGLLQGLFGAVFAVLNMGEFVMAKFELRNSDSAIGPLFVDTTCIDCETCFHLAPKLFKEENNLSIVVEQPVSIKDWEGAKEAIVSCPTNSIGVKDAPPEFKEAQIRLPKNITDGIYFCGYTSKDSYGASSYLIRHPDGNILVDSPKFNAHLVKELEALGGVDFMFLTHQDDVADHEKFHEHFKCKRIIHKSDIQKETAGCEIILEGDEPVLIRSNLIAIPTPGHTRGHMCLLFLDRYLFTGDHLFYNSAKNQLYASKNVNWFSWEKQLESNHRLLDYNFEWVFPGHGGWVHADAMKLKDDIQKIK